MGQYLKILWQTLKTQMKCHILKMQHFIWVCTVCLSPCHTKHWHKVVHTSRERWDHKPILIFFVEKGLSLRPYSDHGVPTEYSLAIICTPTTLLPQLRFHYVWTALTACWRRSVGISEPFWSHLLALDANYRYTMLLTCTFVFDKV